jgi:DNA-binding NtrC family response regulator
VAGNVRELQNVIKRALTWAREEVVQTGDLPRKSWRRRECAAAGGDGFFGAAERQIAAFEQGYLQALLRGGLGMFCRGGGARLPRGTLYRLLKKYRSTADFRRG